MSELLIALSARMEPHLRDHIARADYGQDVAEHRAAIDAICASGHIPKRFDWVPAEVLELIRWVDPCNTNVNWELPTNELHLVRAFCCTALLMQSEGDDFGVDSTLGNLAASLLAMGQSYLRLLPPLLTHLLSEDDPCESDMALTHVVRLLVALELGETLDGVLEDVVGAESLAREVSQPGKRREVGFAGIKSILAANGWHVVANRIRELSADLEDLEQGYFVGEIAQGLLVIGRH